MQLWIQALNFPPVWGTQGSIDNGQSAVGNGKSPDPQTIRIRLVIDRRVGRCHVGRAATGICRGLPARRTTKLKVPPLGPARPVANRCERRDLRNRRTSRGRIAPVFFFSCQLSALSLLSVRPRFEPGSVRAARKSFVLRENQEGRFTRRTQRLHEGSPRISLNSQPRGGVARRTSAGLHAAQAES